MKFYEHGEPLTTAQKDWIMVCIGISYAAFVLLIVAN